ncbi:hypothetical protein [Selenomonas sp. AE3005]|uniref:hypothetical protein n=1 Tax=Selenomonas sp. AE3005 TaxID=1485543 RepID=UPI0025E6DF3F|nr:hypothetical protein [Selenomonas sp. AE3005]
MQGYATPAKESLRITIKRLRMQALFLWTGTGLAPLKDGREEGILGTIAVLKSLNWDKKTLR